MPANSRNGREWAMLIALSMLGIQIGLVAAALTSERRGNADFRALFAAGAIVRSGHAHWLYDYAYEAGVQNALCEKREAALPFLYPPFAALLFVPLAGFSYTAAFAVFACVNLACAGACAWILVRIAVRIAHVPRLAVLLACACCVGFTPLGFALLQGQVSVLLLLALCLCQLALESQNPFAAGICLALTLVKFQIALPIALLFLLWRQWRFFLGFAAGTGALFGVSIAVTGATGILDYCASLTGIAHTVARGAAQTHYGIFPAKMPNLHGLAALMLGNGVVALAVTAVLSVGIMAWVRSRRPSLPVALMAALLVSYHLQPHDLTLLLLPLAISVGRLLETQLAALQTACTLVLLLPPVYLLLEGTAMMPLVTVPMFLLLLSFAERRRPLLDRVGA